MKKLGKKQQPVNYDRTNLKGLANYMERTRAPMNGGSLPKLCINLDRLEETIKGLPRKPREATEKFWGLIPGTINHSFGKSKLGKDAYDIMFTNAKEVIKDLLTLEYSSRYDENVASLVEKLAAKVDKGDMEMSNIEVVKYLIAFFIIFYGGPQMLYEKEDSIDTGIDNKAVLDEYAMLLETDNELKGLIPDNSINLKLWMQVIEMLDIKDGLAIKKFARLNISKEDLRTFDEIEDIKVLQQIRAFKERIFPYGGWWVTTNLILDPTKVELDGFMDRLDLLRRDWGNIKLFRSKTKQVMTSQGERDLLVYNIGGLEFTDPYEVMLLYVARNLIFQEK